MSIINMENGELEQSKKWYFYYSVLTFFFEHFRFICSSTMGEIQGFFACFGIMSPNFNLSMFPEPANWQVGYFQQISVGW